MMQESLAERLRVLRAQHGLSLTEASEKIGVNRHTLRDLELGKREPYGPTIRKIAEGYGVPVAQLFEEPVPFLADAPEAGLTGQAEAAKSPAGDTLEEEQAAEPLSPKLSRLAAQARRAALDLVLKHLTLRLETLRDQAKTLYEAGAAPEEFRTVFIDSLLLARGAEAWLIDSKEEAEELGRETAEERRLRGRLEYRIEDVDEARGEISDMWKKLRDAKNEAEYEAGRKEPRPEAELPDLVDVPNIFSRRKRAG